MTYTNLLLQTANKCISLVDFLEGLSAHFYDTESSQFLKLILANLTATYIYYKLLMI